MSGAELLRVMRERLLDGPLLAEDREEMAKDLGRLIEDTTASPNFGRIVTGTTARTLAPGTRVVRCEPDTEVPAVMARVLEVGPSGRDALDNGGPYLVVHEPEQEPIAVGAVLKSVDALRRVPIGTTLETSGGAIVTYEGNERFAYTGMSERQAASSAWLPATVLLMRPTPTGAS